MAVDTTAVVAAVKADILNRWLAKLGQTPGAFAGVIDAANPTHRAIFADVLRAYAESFENETPMVWPAQVDTAAQSRAEARVQEVLDGLNG